MENVQAIDSEPIARRPTDELRQLAAFLAIGGGAAGVFVLLSQLIVGHTGLVPDWLASGGIYAGMVVPVYLLHRRFSFVSAAPHGRALPRYVLLQASMVLLSALFSYVAYRVLGLTTPIAAVLVTVLTSGVSFAVSRFWVFSAPAAA